MGIKRLKTYLVENNHTARTNLKNAADKWRPKGGEPALLVDTLNIVYHVVDYSETDCCMGEYPSIEVKFQEIIQAFKDIGIKLLFFMDGSVDETRMDSWKKRRVKNMHRYQNCFEKILTLRVGDFGQAEIFPFLSPTVGEETIKLHSEIIYTNGDPDLAMAQYVVKNKCLGILSEDTDFLVYDGIPHVFSPEGLIQSICRQYRENGAPFDPHRLEATEYLRTSFASEIGLQLKAFPIFATLAGNDFIDFSDMMNYCKGRFGTSYFRKIAPELAEIAKSIYIRSNGDVETAALYLAKEIYQNRDFKNNMKDSLKSYDLNYTGSIKPMPYKCTNEQWNQLYQQLSMEGDMDRKVKGILLTQKYTQGERFEDSAKSSGDTLKDLRRRIYSAMFHEKSGETEFVEEYVATKPDCIDFQYLVSTIKVEVDHPGLWNLAHGGEELDDTRWKIVWWVLTPTTPISSVTPVSYDKFRILINLPDGMKLIRLCVFYLYRVLNEITKRETSVILLMASIISVYSAEALREFSMFGEYTSKRAVCVASLYQQTYDYVKRITIDVCNLKIKYKTSHCYSGHLFHWLHRFEGDFIELRDRLLSDVWDKFYLLEEILESST